MNKITILLTFALLVSGLALADQRRTYEEGVVGLVVTHQDWNEDRPWAKKNPDTRRASGVVVQGPYILTTAQMVSSATYIQLEKFGRATRFEPRVFHVDPEIDLALLEVPESEFYRDLKPVSVARETPVQGLVNSVRWNAQQLEALPSRVKRFEVQEGWFGRLRHVFMLMQTDMSGGGWAEPVFQGDVLTGLTVSQNEQRARVIPAEIIHTYLKRVFSGDEYQGFPVLGVHWQVNENPSMADFLGQGGEPEGVLIRQVPWGSSGCGVMKPRDILLSINGKQIDSGGFYDNPRLGRLEFTDIVVSGHAVGDVVPVKVLRGGKVLELEMVLRTYPTNGQYIPMRRGDRPPPYVVAGGLVFRELDGDYLRSWGPEWSSNAPLALTTRFWLEDDAQQPDRRRIILLASVMPSQYTVGYESLRDLPVRKINNIDIDSITEVAQAFENPVDGYHVIELEPNIERDEIVLDTAMFDAVNAEILRAYQVPAAMRLPASPPPDHGPTCEGDF